MSVRGCGRRVTAGSALAEKLLASAVFAAFLVRGPRRCSRYETGPGVEQAGHPSVDLGDTSLRLDATHRHQSPCTLHRCDSAIASDLARSRPAQAPIRRHRSLEALQRELTRSVGVNCAVEKSLHALRHQNLAAARLPTEARREIGDSADRPVVDAPGEANAADG